MVDYKNAFALEKKIFEMLKDHPKCKKYKLALHEDDIYGIDIVATASGYEEFAIEIESTQGSKWGKGDPYVSNWKWFSVPVRKRKFFDLHPMSLFVKVNSYTTRAAVIPMSYVCSAEPEDYDNENAGHMRCNEFFKIYDSKHPAICFCPVEDIAEVVDAQFKAMVQMKRINAKFTDKRPTFGTRKKEN